MTREEFKEKRLKLGYETRRDLAEAMGITLRHRALGVWAPPDSQVGAKTA